MHFLSKFVGHRPGVATLILRLGVGAVFLVHGIQKLGSMSDTIGFFQMINIPAPAFFGWVVALAETIGGAALIVGLGTHIAALILAIVIAVAIITVKWSKGFFGGYEYDLVLFVTLLSLMFQGAGKYSLDAKCKCDNCQAVPPSQI